MDDHFSLSFRALTKGYEPLRWQRRLFERFCRNDIPKVCDLPTGLGKTNVIHLWLLALRQQILEKKPRLPTRLVYVVDRRTVVDQATEIAEEIKENLEDDFLSVSTLRGQFADNREWTRDPSRPAIIIGTVDMIGSRLLFSGYRSSYKVRPLDAGLLGRDTLLVLDEAHLSEPFAKLSRWIERLNLDSLFVMHMSATGMGAAIDRFTLVPSDLEGDRDTNPIVRRYESDKRLIIRKDITDLHTAIVNDTTELAKDNSRVVVFVRSPEAATKLAAAIRNHGDNKKSFATSVAVLTGTMRGLERDKLLEKTEEAYKPEQQVMQRFLHPTNRPDEGRAILVSTSAGEVGFDLNADHLVCDAAPLDSIIQRFGRVNRRGDGIAQVHLFVEKTKEPAKKQGGKPAPAKQAIEAASAAAIDALKRLPKVQEDSAGIVYDASPKAFASLTKPDEALSPKPATVEITDILLDAWSMTSITEPMPGRPPVAPWLRGIDDALPQTTVAWRVELEILGDSEVDRETLEIILQKHRIRPHETLTARTDQVVEFLKRAVKANPGLAERRVLLLASELRSMPVGDLLNDPSPLRADPTLILPAHFGGLDAGMLDEGSVTRAHQSASSTTPSSLDVADEPGYERRKTDAARRRLLLEHTEEGWVAKPIPDAMLPESLKDLPYCDRAALEDEIKRRLGMNLRLRQAMKTDSEGDVTLYLLSLYPAQSKKPSSAQALNEHVKAVEVCAARIGGDLQLAEPFLSALESAAKYHDEGKKSRTWQHAIGNYDLSHPRGKSGGKMNVKRLGGYRHEFGTLLHLTDSKKPVDVPAVPESLELMYHLIATHHGSGRPHFKRPDDIDYDDRKRCPRISVEVMCRFARLQRQYGHWRLAWLENLLRCADAKASTENDEEDT